MFLILYAMNIRKAFQIFMFLLVAVYLLSIIALPEKIIMKIIREGGPIENAQVILYITGGIIAWVYARRRIWTDGLYGSFILLLFAMRELDFQKKFTGISITRTKYYFNSDASLTSKLLFGVIVCGIILFVLFFLFKNAPHFLRAIRSRVAWAHSALAGIVCILLTQLIDSAPRLLDSIGVETFHKFHLYKNAVEELCELSIPFFFVNALLLYGQSTHTASSNRYPTSDQS